MSVLCECMGAGCPYCAFERRAASGGEQGPTAIELELEQTRRDAASWQRRALKAERELAETREDRDEAERVAAYAGRDRDAALAQLALLSKGGAA